MSAELDRVIAAMSLEEEEVEPLQIPNRPEYFSVEKNELSLIGRIMNPLCQKVSDVVLDMPRKWQKIGRVRGVALTKKRFQFIFNYEHDLLKVLEKGVQSHNDWTIVLERWQRNPPYGFLQFIHVWVHVRNIHVDNYTALAITDMCEILGRVDVVALEESKSQSREYVRVKILINVARPLRQSREIMQPTGEKSLVYFAYENIYKRCYKCQGLTHEKSSCPLLNKQPSQSTPQGERRPEQNWNSASSAIDETLGQLIKENLGGPSTISGRPVINPEVLEEMKRYLLSANGDDRVIKESRFTASLKEVAKDTMMQKRVLRLEKLLVVSSEIDKGKGMVVEINSDPITQSTRCNLPSSKLLFDAIKVGKSQSSPPMIVNDQNIEIVREFGDSNFLRSVDPLLDLNLVDAAGSSGIRKKRSYQRKKPIEGKRMVRETAIENNQMEIDNQERNLEGRKDKRKRNDEQPPKKKECKVASVVIRKAEEQAEEASKKQKLSDELVDSLVGLPKE